MCETKEFETVTQWYDNCTEAYQDLYDAIVDRIPHADKWDVDQVIEFIEEIRDLGIDTASRFEDAYYLHTDEYNPEKWFAEEYYDSIGVLPSSDAAPGSELFSYIDWQLVWDSLLRYDFSTFEFDGDTYFFNNNF